jgi:hypothetical protein
VLLVPSTKEELPLPRVSLFGLPPYVSTETDGANFVMEEVVEWLVVRLRL